MASMTQSHSTFLPSNNLLSRLVTEHKNVAGSYYFFWMQYLITCMSAGVTFEINVLWDAMSSHRI